MSLFKLPNELLREIINDPSLELNDILALCTTNKLLNNLATPRLDRSCNIYQDVDGLILTLATKPVNEGQVYLRRIEMRWTAHITKFLLSTSLYLESLGIDS